MNPINDSYQNARVAVQNIVEEVALTATNVQNVDAPIVWTSKNNPSVYLVVPSQPNPNSDYKINPYSQV